MTSSPNTADTMDARVEAALRVYLSLSPSAVVVGPKLQRMRAALAASDAVAQAPLDPDERQELRRLRFEAAQYSNAQDIIMRAAAKLEHHVAVAQAPQQPVTFTYSRTFNAIAAATSINAVGIGISVKAFIEAFNAGAPGPSPREEDVQRLVEPDERHELECLRYQEAQRDYPCSPHCSGYLRELAIRNTAAEAIATARREALEQAIDRVDSAYPPDTIETSHQVQIFSDMKAFFVSRIRALIQSQPLQEER